MKRLQFPLLIGADAQYNSRFSHKELGVSLPSTSIVLQAVHFNRNGS